jgi:hypothetical protein
MVSAVAPGAVVNTDLLPRHLPFLPSERIAFDRYWAAPGSKRFLGSQSCCA